MRLNVPNAPYDYVITYDDLINNGMSITRANSDITTSEFGTRLLNLTYACDLIMLNGRHPGDQTGKLTFLNHNGRSLIDYVLCDKMSMYNIIDFKVHDVNIDSDHKIISYSIATQIIKHIDYDETADIGLDGNVDGRGGSDINHAGRIDATGERGDQVEERGEQSMRDGDAGLDREQIRAKWRSDKRDEFITELETNATKEKLIAMNTLLNNSHDDEGIETCITDFTAVLLQAGAGHIKVGGAKRGNRRRKRGGKPWYDADCTRQKELFIDRQKQHTDDDTDVNRISMCAERSKYRKLCKRKDKQYNISEAQKLLNLSKTNPKSFWKIIKSGKKREGPPADCNFFEHFKNLAEMESNVSEEGRAENDTIDQNALEISVEELDREITMEELNNAITKLKKDKSAGADVIINEFLMYSPQHVKTFILNIFNKILELQCFPKCWAEGSIVPIFKSGDRHNTNNYRGITLLSCIGKLFTRVINDRLTTWADKNGVINENQLGFRKGRGTVDCLFILNGLIQMMLSKGKKLYCCFVDYQKAFDYVDRATLWSKLVNENVSSKIITLLKNMYSKINLSVKGDKRVFKSSCGVLQGESTSPILFSLYINDLENVMSDDWCGTKIQDVIIKLLMFADDTAIISETRKGLQKAIDELDKYCSKWGITVNVLKTKIVVFRKPGRLADGDKWTYRGNEIEIVPFFKYLGCFLSSSGSFTKCTQELVKSARRALFALKVFFSKNKELPPSLKLMFFDSMVRPILSYGAEVWGLCKAEPIEVFYREFLKYILRVKTSTPNIYVYGELGVYPLYVERQMRALKYWSRIIDPENNKGTFVKIVYNEMYQLSIDEPRKCTWATSIRDTLYRLNLGCYWETQTVSSNTFFNTLVRRRLQDMYLTEWTHDVIDSTDGRLFRSLKMSFCYEPYLDNIHNSAIRNAITRLRLSSHRYRIETGRWGENKIPREQRKCIFCNVVESEYHVLVKCPRFVNERMGLLPECLINNPCEAVFLRIFQSEDVNVQLQLGLLCLKVEKEYLNYV